jgi:hypothetical protein
MAEFCTKCAKQLFGDQAIPEIDVMKEFNEMDPGMCSSGWVCEGCGLTDIGKTEEGELKVIRIPLDEDETDENISTWEDY